MKSSPRLPQIKEALAQKQRPNIVMNQSINKSLKKKKKKKHWALVKLTLIQNTLSPSENKVMPEHLCTNKEKMPCWLLGQKLNFRKIHWKYLGILKAAYVEVQLPSGKYYREFIFSYFMLL